MENQNNNPGRIGLYAISSVFFIFGFATTFIITLSAPVKAIFDLSEFQAQLLTSAFFIAFPVMSIPGGIIVNRIGYKQAVALGLFLMAIGSVSFLPAARIPSFPLFLFATFVLATGVVFLQVSANPYVTALGPAETASGRLNLTQALNSIATMIAPWLIAVAIFRGLALPVNTGDAEAFALAERTFGHEVASRIPLPFIIMTLIVLSVALVFLVIRLPALAARKQESERKEAWKYPHVLLGAFAVFCYVGAEVGNAGLLVNYLKESSLGLSPEEASTYAAIYWGGAMVGRFFGSLMFSGLKNGIKKYSYVILILALAFVSGAFVTNWNWKIGGIFLAIAFVNFLIMQFGTGKAARTLAIFALIAALLDILTTFSTGHIALWTVISIGLFNSIMFPNIFTLAVKDLDGNELGSASGIVNALIVGGAIIPLIMGSIADNYGYTWAYLVPAFCYVYIFFYAVKGSRIRTV